MCRFCGVIINPVHALYVIVWIRINQTAISDSDKAYEWYIITYLPIFIDGLLVLTHSCQVWFCTPTDLCANNGNYCRSTSTTSEYNEIDDVTSRHARDSFPQIKTKKIYKPKFSDSAKIDEFPIVLFIYLEKLFPNISILRTDSLRDVKMIFWEQYTRRREFSIYSKSKFCIVKRTSFI